jgi:archaeosine-15-forming tRNA-guanine transglycosylase
MLINSNVAKQLDIIHRRGDDFILALEINTETVVVEHVRMELRIKNISQNSSPLLTVTDDDYITLSGTGNRRISFQIPGSVMRIVPNDYVYDIEVVLEGGIVQTWFEGSFKLIRDVTDIVV